MSVLFGLGDMTLLGTLLGQGLGEDIMHGLRGEGNVKGKVGLVPGEGGDVEVLGDVNILHGGRGETEGLDNLTHTIGAEVEAKEGITIREETLLVDENGFKELISLIALIAFLNGLDTIGLLGTTILLGEAIDGQLDALPPLVTVHGVVTTTYGGDGTITQLADVGLQILVVTGGGLWRGITAIAEKVDIGLGDLGGLGSLEKALEVFDVTVDTTIRDEAKEVETSIARGGTIKGGLNVGDLTELALRQGLVDTYNVLVDDATSANVQVANLRVAHEALREANGSTVSEEFGIRVGLLKSGHDRSVGAFNGITFSILLGGDAPAVNDDKADLLLDRRVRGHVEEKGRGVRGEG